MIDDYLKNLTSDERAALQRLRTIIKNQAPQAIEVTSYGMPGFKYDGHYLIGFAAFKNHLSLFPTSEPVEALKGKLQDFVLSKGTIQFTVQKPVPEKIVRELVAHRITAITGGK